MKQIRKLQLENGHEPYQEWLDRLGIKEQARISAFVDRLALGGARRNIKPVGIGVYELKVDYGPGYRVYFGQLGNVIILLLMGGDKKTQERDIRQALMYWRNYASKQIV